MTRTATILALLSAIALASPGSAEESAAEVAGEKPGSSSEGAVEESSPPEDEEGSGSDAGERPQLRPQRARGTQVIPHPTVPGLNRPDGGNSPILPPRARTEDAKESTPSRAAAVATSRRRSMEACEQRPLPAGTHPFAPGESLVFDVDIMGVRAGTMTLAVDDPAGGGHSFTATTTTNTFFANVRQVEGRATSFSRDAGLYPLRYREDAKEDGVDKWSEVLFPAGRNEVDVRFGQGRRERRVRYPVTDSPMDLISLVYYLRTLDLAAGQTFCMDIYANRRVWRITGVIDGEEFVRTPAGGFETYRIAGKAQRLDLPTIERELHVWIAKDERRTPVAAMSTIDLGPVRARLARVDGPGSATRSTSQTGGRW